MAPCAVEAAHPQRASYQPLRLVLGKLRPRGDQSPARGHTARRRQGHPGLHPDPTRVSLAGVPGGATLCASPQDRTAGLLQRPGLSSQAALCAAGLRGGCGPREPGELGQGVGSSEQVDHLPSPRYCPLCGFGGPPAGQLTPPSSLFRASWRTRVTRFSSGRSAGRW